MKEKKLNMAELVKLVNPEPGEEKIIYRITNFNEETERCYIEPVNLDFAHPPQELVSISEIENIQR